MKSPNLTQSISKRRVPQQGTAAYKRWRQSIAAGKRRVKERRIEVGLLTATEVGHKFGLSRGVINRMVDRGELHAIGPRRLIHESEAGRVLGGGPRPEGTTAIEGARP
jgi:hypothetical protein